MKCDRQCTKNNVNVVGSLGYSAFRPLILCIIRTNLVRRHFFSFFSLNFTINYEIMMIYHQYLSLYKSFTANTPSISSLSLPIKRKITIFHAIVLIFL